MCKFTYKGLSNISMKVCISGYAYTKSLIFYPLKIKNKQSDLGYWKLLLVAKVEILNLP